MTTLLPACLRRHGLLAATITFAAFVAPTAAAARGSGPVVAPRLAMLARHATAPLSPLLLGGPTRLHSAAHPAVPSPPVGRVAPPVPAGPPAAPKAEPGAGPSTSKAWPAAVGAAAAFSLTTATAAPSRPRPSILVDTTQAPAGAHTWSVSERLANPASAASTGGPGATATDAAVTMATPAAGSSSALPSPSVDDAVQLVMFPTTTARSPRMAGVVVMTEAAHPNGETRSRRAALALWNPAARGGDVAPLSTLIDTVAQDGLATGGSPIQVTEAPQTPSSYENVEVYLGDGEGLSPFVAGRRQMEETAVNSFGRGIAGAAGVQYLFPGGWATRLQVEHEFVNKLEVPEESGNISLQVRLRF